MHVWTHTCTGISRPQSAKGSMRKNICCICDRQRVNTPGTKEKALANQYGKDKFSNRKVVKGHEQTIQRRRNTNGQ